MDRYRELRKLGQGCYGEVLLVQRLEDSSQVYALKRVFMDIEDEEQSGTLALGTEVQILSKLDHPNIVSYYESFVHDHSLCIIMEYADCGDLLRRIKEVKSLNRKFPETQIWDWAVQLLQALHHIHSRKIIHRDLKSRNIFLTTSGQLKLGDFGISRILQSTDDLAKTNVGTPYYLAPEVCTGQGYDTKADIWSLGCVLYELCMLRRPFEGESLAGIIQKVLNADYEPIESGYSPELRNLVDSMLQKDPGNRANAEQLLQSPQIALRLPEDRPRKLVFASEKRISKRPYQREMSINIPTPTTSILLHEPYSAPSPRRSNQEISTTAHSSECPIPVEETKDGADTEKAQTSRHFTFSESLLKQCPRSPNRPLLMGDFLKKKLGPEVFAKVKQMVLTLADPGKTLKEQSWLFSDVCGEENLSVVDVGIAFGAFNAQSKVPFPPTSTSKAGFRKFPTLRKPSAD